MDIIFLFLCMGQVKSCSIKDERDLSYILLERKKSSFHDCLLKAFLQTPSS